jgi:hypothetical protein
VTVNHFEDDTFRCRNGKQKFYSPINEEEIMKGAKGNFLITRASKMKN